VNHLFDNEKAIQSYFSAYFKENKTSEIGELSKFTVEDYV